MGTVLFFWLAFCFTIWAWVRVLGGKFIRASLWFSAGVGMLIWWGYGDASFDDWWKVSIVFVGTGVGWPGLCI
jgi:hypothetical protein